MENRFGFSHDNRWVYLITSIGAETGRLVAVDTVTKKMKVKAEDSRYDIKGVFRHPKKHSILAAQFTGERVCWDVVDNSVADDLNVLKGLYNGDFNIQSASIANDKWIVEYIKDNASPKYCYYDRSAKKTLISVQLTPGD